MILGLDHIALSCRDINEAAQDLARVGYKIRFLDRDVPNRPVKRAFLRDYVPLHSLAYCHHPDHPPIELTQHSAPLQGDPGIYEPLLAFDTDADVSARSTPKLHTAAWSLAFDIHADPALWNPLGAPMWTSSSPIQGARAVLCQVTDLDESTALWTDGLGFRWNGEANKGSGEDGGTDWCRLTRAGPFSDWSLDLLLVEHLSASRSSTTLDAPGFPCLAFLCTDLTADTEHLTACGLMETTGEFQVVVNDRRLLVNVGRGPSGELIELIQILEDADHER